MPFGSKMALIILDNRKFAKRTFYCMMNTGFWAGIMIPVSNIFQLIFFVNYLSHAATAKFMGYLFKS